MRTCDWKTGLMVLALAGGSTCGSSTPQLGDTGLPEDEALFALSADDWQIFCKAVDAARRKPPEEECRRLGFTETRGIAEVEGTTDADVRATCKARYDSCMREYRPPPRSASSCIFGPVGPDCTATVGEAEQCLMASLARRTDDDAMVPSCATVTTAQAKATAGTIGSKEGPLLDLPPCQNFQSKCAGLIR